RIIKPFYWKYPMYKFVSFRELKNLSRDTYLKHLQDGIITVWVDEETPFGYIPLEAIRCDNIVVGKIPETVPEWMEDENGIKNNGLWVYNINEIPEMIAKAIGSWMRNEVPENLLGEMNKTKELYTLDMWRKNVIETFDNIVDEQITTFTEVKNNIEKTEE
ncbi:MAG: hypothetical protein K2H20_01540, partial [Bacilli bacterium]|nr:hypothetical protein [Bacilli bacterium]